MVMLMDLRVPAASSITTFFPSTGFPDRMVWCSAHRPSQMLARRISLHGMPMARARGVPVIFSAALLKEVIRNDLSTVKTPSVIESRMMVWISSGMGRTFPWGIRGSPCQA